MANMSYCRFNNTVIDLRDCIDTLQGCNSGIHSEDEKKKAKQLIGMMVDFLYDIDIIDEIPDDIDETIADCINSVQEDEE